ncbi:GTPase [Pseudoclavibacter endophyticus]|uniref:GTP-binding protein n=1 Tax=Pseudoclavibacter endophyticus TaxID=1778590 RepID=A0A6H9WH31_9MICO|nr:dynamin family protein [Pseudoclavibacter endophyticus]KAB1648344.1 GTP-binding protein [Pseudoclavibacter endophyticus]GGA71841.1 GTPase [Pseudoclavibacter endophyticus]
MNDGNDHGAGGDRGELVTAAHRLIEDALRVFADSPEACASLRAAAARLDEPLRVAIAGMVKAGKSTLLNAIIGDEIAPTDAGECTRVVTWYRYGRTPRITLHTTAGTSRELPVTRIDGRLEVRLADVAAAEVDRLEVEWPTSGLRHLTLIDTPGIASLSADVSARSTDALIPDNGASVADAMIYLLRHPRETDVEFLEAFRASTEGASGTVCAIAVLSRADEIGAGRIDAMLSAQDIAARYRSQGALQDLALDLIPIAGLLAQSARTLRESEFEALVELAGLERADRDRMLLSADRFVRPTPGITVSPARRAALLDRFGVFGVRVAASLLRGAAGTSSTALAAALRGQSGLDSLLDAVERLMRARTDLLKARGALTVVERVLRDDARRGGSVRREGVERLSAALECMLANAHGLDELRLVARLRGVGTGLGRLLEREAERLVGAFGDTPRERLGLPADAPVTEAIARARRLAGAWRSRARDPRLASEAARACAVVTRSAEAQVALLAADGTRSRARLALLSEPVAGVGQE